MFSMPHAGASGTETSVGLARGADGQPPGLFFLAKIARLPAQTLTKILCLRGPI